ncbi:hypothetical protein VTJ83DRAFT_7160 [Remersonia thermophila]|uniref:Phosphoglycerate mutase n=1 Tax=Remersonia thermophila TaxID=72144 RepID=A0ABR4D2T3_9PEZI
MPTYLHLVRHAQGYHNLHPDNHVLPDPDLTPLGEEQCARLRRAFPYHDKVTHLVASPLRRTLKTCLLAFGDEGEHDGAAGKNKNNNKQKKKVLALPEIQEISPLPCDVGSPVEALAAEFGDDAVDLSLAAALGGGAAWADKRSRASPFAPTAARLEARASKARRFLRGLGREWARRQQQEEREKEKEEGEGEEEGEGSGGDAHIVVVTHGGFLHFLTQDFDGVDVRAGTGWANCEWRTYEFVSDEEEGGEENDGEARLRETRESWRRRRGSATGLTETEQMELRAAMAGKMVEEWGVEGDGEA